MQDRRRARFVELIEQLRPARLFRGRAKTSWITPIGCCAAKSRSLPDGTYEAEGVLDGFVEHPTPIQGPAGSRSRSRSTDQTSPST